VLQPRWSATPFVLYGYNIDKYDKSLSSVRNGEGM